MTTFQGLGSLFAVTTSFQAPYDHGNAICYLFCWETSREVASEGDRGEQLTQPPAAALYMLVASTASLRLPGWLSGWIGNQLNPLRHQQVYVSLWIPGSLPGATSPHSAEWSTWSLNNCEWTSQDGSHWGKQLYDVPFNNCFTQQLRFQAQLWL